MDREPRAGSWGREALKQECSKNTFVKEPQKLFPSCIVKEFDCLTETIFSEKFKLNGFNDRWWDYSDTVTILNSAQDFGTYNVMSSKIIQWREDAHELKADEGDRAYLGIIRKMQVLLHCARTPSFYGIVLLIKEIIDPKMSPAVEYEILSSYEHRFTYVRMLAALKAIVLRCIYQGFSDGSKLGKRLGVIINTINSVYMKNNPPGKVLCLYQRVLREIMEACIDGETNCLFHIEFLAAEQKVHDYHLSRDAPKVKLPETFRIWAEKQQRIEGERKPYICEPDEKIFKNSSQVPFKPEVIVIDKVENTRKLVGKRIKDVVEIKNETMEISDDEKEPERKRPKLLHCDEILDDSFDDAIIAECDAAEAIHQMSIKKKEIDPLRVCVSKNRMKLLEKDFDKFMQAKEDMIYAEEPLLPHVQMKRARKLLDLLMLRLQRNLYEYEAAILLDENDEELVTIPYVAWPHIEGFKIVLKDAWEDRRRYKGDTVETKNFIGA